MHTPHLPPKIPSLRELLEGKADRAVPVPAELPAETPKSEAVNSHQLRYSDSAQHEHLHSNIIPEIMSYTQEPFPERLSERTLRQYGPGAPFRHRETIRGWVENIFVKNGTEKFLELGTTVEKAVKEGDEWVLTLRKEGPGKDYWWREWFDALVVATGHYNIPWFPDIPGLAEYDERFPGRIVHSKHFRGADKFKGKVSIYNPLSRPRENPLIALHFSELSSSAGRFHHTRCFMKSCPRRNTLSMHPSVESLFQRLVGRPSNTLTFRSENRSAALTH